MVFFVFNVVFISISVFVNEEGNELADKAVDVAMTYLKKNTKLGISVDLRRVVGNRTDSNTFLETRKLFLLIIYHISNLKLEGLLLFNFQPIHFNSFLTL